MLRELMVNEGHIAPAGYAAASNCKTGMGVQISHSTGKFAFPSAESATNIFVVKKERYPSGVNAANTQFSDYDEDFNTVKAGEYAPLCNYYAGESFATDQYGPTVKEENVGKYVAVGADGIFIETHPTPNLAKSDGANMLPLDQLEELLTKLVRLRQGL